MTYQKALYALLLLLLIKAFALGLFIAQGPVGLGPDEAQYWTWSQQPALGYYSKPPGIAWQIWMGTKLFGNTELGVRFGALVIGTLLPLAVFSLARHSTLSPSAAFWAGAAMAFCPLGMMASLLAITDGGQVLFWSLATLLVASSLTKERPPSYLLLGLTVLAGALFKWPMYLFWLFALGALRFQHYWRFLGGVALSLLGLLPSLIWNNQHGWVTFRHVAATIEHGATEASTTEAGNFFAFLGSQMALLSPILFALLIVAFWILMRGSHALPPAVAFCGWSSFIIVLGYSLMALFKKMQGNWCDFAYPGAVVYLSWAACDHLKTVKWMAGGTLLALCLSIFSFAIPILQEKNILPLSYSINPYRHNLGWKALGKALSDSGYDPSQHFLFGDKYQTSSILSFYAQGQQRAYFLNLNRVRKNQFSFWPSMKQEQLGQTGYFVVTENIPALTRQLPQLPATYLEKLKPYFARVEYLGNKTLFSSNRRQAKAALIFRCAGYNGCLPTDPALY